MVNYLLKDFVFLWAYSTSINVLHKKWQLASRDSSGIAHLFCAVAGVEGGRLVEAHGSFSTASCTRCHSKQDPQDVKVHTATKCIAFSAGKHKSCWCMHCAISVTYSMCLHVFRKFTAKVAKLGTTYKSVHNSDDYIGRLASLTVMSLNDVWVELYSLHLYCCIQAAIFSDQIPKCKHCNVSDSFVNARAALVVYCHREL